MKTALLSFVLAMILGSATTAVAQDLENFVPAWYAPGAPCPPYGYYQCVAINRFNQAFSNFGPTVDQAAYGALFECGGPAMGCYIPPGYCQFR